MNNRWRLKYKLQLHTFKNDPLVIGVRFPKEAGPYGMHFVCRRSEMKKYEEEYGAKFYLNFF